MSVSKINDLQLNLNEFKFEQTAVMPSISSTIHSSKAALRKFKSEQCYGAKIVASEKKIVPAHFVNTTNTEVHLVIYDRLTQFPPFVYAFVTEFCIPPGACMDMSLFIKGSHGCHKVLAIDTIGGPGYGQTRSEICFDLHNGPLSVEFYSKWVYPGVDFWPPVPPFQIIKARSYS